MSATSFSTQNNTFRQLLGNGLTYRIPRFQRDYSWAEEEWEDLWLDILGTIQDGGEPAHYMGYLVLQSDDSKTFDVIDGQQRLTTLSILVLAVLKQLQGLVSRGVDAERNAQRAQQIRNSYIGYLDPVTLVPRSKLSLNRNDDGYYQTYLVPLTHLPQRGIRASEHSLRRAFEWFDRHLETYVANVGGDSGRELAAFVETMSDRLFFTVMTVTDELNAYKVFETLNARGVRLSATDLLKNHLFSVLHRESQHDQEMKVLEERWEVMVGRLGSESFPDFLRVHWNSRNRFVRQIELFKTIRAQVQDRGAVFSLLREMEEDVDTYTGLTQPESSGWSKGIQEHVVELRMFSVRQPFPLLLAARRQLDDAAFEAVLHACVVISFRFNLIGGLHAHPQEQAYNEVALRIARGDLTDARGIITALAPIYIHDEPFKASFRDKIIRTTQARNKRVVRYILCTIEKHISGIESDFDSDTFNLEHILPQHPGDGWDAFGEAEIEALVYRLGNMTLLDASVNRDLANADYATKRSRYESSNFEITRRIAQDYQEWRPERVAARQRWMADQATAIWRLGQLS